MYTPGPWLLNEAGDILSADGLHTIAFMINDGDWRSETQLLADAALIAAATDMIYALLAAFGEPNGSSLESEQGTHAIVTVRAAIAATEMVPL